MKRRTLLAAAAAATTATAGCLDDGSSGTPADTPTGEATPSPTETPARPRLVDRSFEVTRVECGDEHGEYDVTTADGVVTVEGTVDGANGCYTAELVAAEYDADADELYVEVQSVEDRDEGTACTTCIVEIDYVAEFTFEGGEPSSVRVEQRGAADRAEGDGTDGTPTDGGTPTDDGTETDSETTPY